MIVARFLVEARFGHKQKVIEMMRSWDQQFGTKVGWTSDKTRTLTGSIGAPESLIINEIRLESLSELDTSFQKLATLDGHAEWGREIEPYIVSGSNRWEILREI